MMPQLSPEPNNRPSFTRRMNSSSSQDADDGAANLNENDHHNNHNHNQQQQQEQRPSQLFDASSSSLFTPSAVPTADQYIDASASGDINDFMEEATDADVVNRNISATTVNNDPSQNNPPQELEEQQQPQPQPQQFDFKSNREKFKAMADTGGGIPTTASAAAAAPIVPAWKLKLIQKQQAQKAQQQQQQESAAIAIDIIDHDKIITNVPLKKEPLKFNNPFGNGNNEHRQKTRRESSRLSISGTSITSEKAGASSSVTTSSSVNFSYKDLYGDKNEDIGLYNNEDTNNNKWERAGSIRSSSSRASMSVKSMMSATSKRHFQLHGTEEEYDGRGSMVSASRSMNMNMNANMNNSIHGASSVNSIHGASSVTHSVKSYHSSIMEVTSKPTSFGERRPSMSSYRGESSNSFYSRGTEYSGSHGGSMVSVSVPSKEEGIDGGDGGHEDSFANLDNDTDGDDGESDIDVMGELRNDEILPEGLGGQRQGDKRPQNSLVSSVVESFQVSSVAESFKNLLGSLDVEQQQQQQQHHHQQQSQEGIKEPSLLGTTVEQLPQDEEEERRRSSLLMPLPNHQWNSQQQQQQQRSFQQQLDQSHRSRDDSKAHSVYEESQTSQSGNNSEAVASTDLINQLLYDQLLDDNCKVHVDKCREHAEKKKRKKQQHPQQQQQLSNNDEYYHCDEDLEDDMKLLEQVALTHHGATYLNRRGSSDDRGGHDDDDDDDDDDDQHSSCSSEGEIRSSTGALHEQGGGCNAVGVDDRGQLLDTETQQFRGTGEGESQTSDPGGEDRVNALGPPPPDRGAAGGTVPFWKRLSGSINSSMSDAIVSEGSAAKKMPSSSVEHEKDPEGEGSHQPLRRESSDHDLTPPTDCSHTSSQSSSATNPPQTAQSETSLPQTGPGFLRAFGIKFDPHQDSEQSLCSDGGDQVVDSLEGSLANIEAEVTAEQDIVDSMEIASTHPSNNEPITSQSNQLNQEMKEEMGSHEGLVDTLNNANIAPEEQTHLIVQLEALVINNQAKGRDDSSSGSVSRFRPSLVNDFKSAADRKSFQRRISVSSQTSHEEAVDWPSPVSSLGSPPTVPKEMASIQQGQADDCNSEALASDKVSTVNSNDSGSKSKEGIVLSIVKDSLHDNSKCDDTHDDDESDGGEMHDVNLPIHQKVEAVHRDNGSSDTKENPTDREGAKTGTAQSEGDSRSLDEEGGNHVSSTGVNRPNQRDVENLFPPPPLSQGRASEDKGIGGEKQGSSHDFIEPPANRLDEHLDFGDSMSLDQLDFGDELNNAASSIVWAAISELEKSADTAEKYTDEIPPSFSAVEPLLATEEGEYLTYKSGEHDQVLGTRQVPTFREEEAELLVSSMQRLQGRRNSRRARRRSSTGRRGPGSEVSSLDSFASPTFKARERTDSFSSLDSLASPTQAMVQKAEDAAKDIVADAKHKPVEGNKEVGDSQDAGVPEMDANMYRSMRHCMERDDSSKKIQKRTSFKISDDDSISVDDLDFDDENVYENIDDNAQFHQSSGLGEDVALHLGHSTHSMATYFSSDGIDHIDPNATDEGQDDFDFAMNAYSDAVKYGHFYFHDDKDNEDDSAWDGNDQVLAARAYMGLGFARQCKGELECALVAYTQALTMLEEEIGENDPMNAPIRYTIGTILIEMQRLLEASTHFNKALQLFKSKAPQSRSSILCTEGMLFSVLGEGNRAIDRFRQAVLMHQTPNQSMNLKFATVMFELGSVLSQQGLYDDSANCFNFALEIRKAMLGDSFVVARTHYSLGVTKASQELRSNSDIASSSHLEEALRICQQEFEEEHLQSAIIVHALGVLNERKGDFLSASVWFAKERNMRKQLFSEDHESVANVCADLGTCYYNSGKYELAIATFEDGLQIVLLAETDQSLDVAEALYKIASCHDSLCNYDEALEKFDEVKQIRESLFGVESSPVIQTMLRIGNIQLCKGEVKKALDCFNEVLGIGYASDSVNAVEVANALYGRGCAQFCGFNLDDAMKSLSESLNWKLAALGEDDPGLACIFYQMAHVYLEKDDSEEAITCFEEYARLQKLETQRNLHDNAEICYAEGIVAKLKGRQDAALSFYKQALAMFDTLFGGDHEKVASIHFDIGCVYSLLGDNESALGHFQACLLQRRKLLGGHVDVANTLYEMASIYGQEDRVELAVKCLAESDRIWKAKLKDNEKLTSVLLLSAKQWKALQCYQPSEENLEQALEQAITTYGQSHESVATILLTLGELLQEISQIQQALFCFDEAIQVRTVIFGPESPSVAQVEYSKGVALLFHGDFEAASNCLNQALTIRQQKLGPMDGTVGDTLNTIGFLQIRMGKINGEEALEPLKQALEIRRAVGNVSKVISTLQNIASLYKKRKQFDSCIETHAEILAVRQEEFGKDDARVADAWISLGNIQTSTGRLVEATISYEEALRIRTLLNGYNHLSVAQVLFKIGSLNSRQNNYTDAKQLFEEYMRIRAEEEDDPDEEMAQALTLMGDLQKESGEKSKATINWMSALEIYQQLGYPESHPKLSKLRARQRTVPSSFGFSSRKSVSDFSVRSFFGAGGSKQGN